MKNKKNRSLIEKFKKSFEKNANNIFLFDSMKDEEYSYEIFEELSKKMATYLKNNSISKGDRVCVVLPNQIEVLLIYFACMQLGAVSVPINIGLKSEEIKYIILDSKPKLIFGNKSTSNFLDINNEADWIYVDKINLLEEICGLPLNSTKSFENVEDVDTMFIVYTSGTTNTPKGVVLSYRSIIGNALSFNEMTGVTTNHRFYEVLPLSYLAGLFNTVIVPFCAGGSVVLDETFNIKTMFNFWKKVIRYKINSFWLNPSIIFIIVNYDKNKEGVEYCKNGGVKAIFVGTAPLSKSLEKSFREKYGVQLNESYGLSEVLIISSNSSKFKKNKGVGKILSGQDVRILNKQGIPCKKEVDGEIVVKSDFVMDCYLNKDKETHKTIRKELFYTGDIGHIDEEGYLFITGRKKDLIIRGGRNISPKEIEEVIMNSGLVREVAVVGLSEDVGGEKIVAAVVSKNEELNSEEILTFCKDKLAPFKIPHKIFQINSLPRNVNGKVQKNVLIKQLKK